ncbi:hypothetical protein P3T39_002658 [Kitasatospora sp. GP82]|nr:hypothetical protein [Kitasatospora sp. GP82]
MKTRAAGLVVSGLTSLALVVLGSSTAHAYSDWSSEVTASGWGMSGSPLVVALLGQAGGGNSTGNAWALEFIMPERGGEAAPAWGEDSASMAPPGEHA